MYSGVYPFINITWPGHGGDQVLQHYVDTRSSNTFFIQSEFTCLGTHFHRTPRHDRRWGPRYDHNRGNFTAIDSEDFDILYFPENEELYGSIGWSPVRIAGVDLRAKVAMVNRSLYVGDGHSSELLGLAYPSVTNAFKGSGTHGMYDPVLVAMCKQGKVLQGFFFPGH